MGRGGSPIAAGSSRSMRGHVCAGFRTPRGIGAVLFVVGGAIVGAAVVAWRRQRCGGRGEDAKNHSGEQPASEEVLDGCVVEEEEQGKFDQSDENLSRRDIGVEANDLNGNATEELHLIQNSKATEEIHQVQEEDEIVTTDESDGKPVEKFDQELSRESASIITDYMDGKTTEELHQIPTGKATENVHETRDHEIIADESEDPEEEFDQKSRTDSAEIIMDDKEIGEMKSTDENSSMCDVEILENKITLNVATENVDNSDQSTLTISSPEIVHGEHNDHNGVAQETAPLQTTPTPQLMMHQFSDEAKTETVQAESAEGTTMEKDVFEQAEQKPLAEPAELPTSPVNPSPPSLPKLPEEKGVANLGPNKTGLKLKQDSISGELSKGFTKHGVPDVTMDRRAASMAILTLIFAVTIGVNIVMRLYSSLRAT